MNEYIFVLLIRSSSGFQSNLDIKISPKEFKEESEHVTKTAFMGEPYPCRYTLTEAKTYLEAIARGIRVKIAREAHIPTPLFKVNISEAGDKVVLPLHV